MPPLNMISADQARRRRRERDVAKWRIGPMHYMAKIHAILRSPFALATHPGIPDVAEQCIGPDILLYNATYLFK